MDSALKKVIAVLVAAFILSIAYYGTYLPLHKSQSFIVALRSLRPGQQVQDFEDTMSAVFEIPSPVGQEELVRNTANIVLNIIQQTNDPKIISRAIAFIENHYQPIIDRDRGMSFEQNLFILGTINEIAFSKTRDVRFLEKSAKFYARGLELGPKRPQFLYGMFDIHRITGNVDGAKKIAAQILDQWPWDARTRDGLEAFLKLVAASVTQQPPK
jgi:hypothetical protein